MSGQAAAVSPAEPFTFMNIPFADVLPTGVSWLPAILQAPETYFVMFVSFAAFGFVKGFPITDKNPWIAELATWAVGTLLAFGLKVGNSYWYAGGTGIVAAWGASSFYTLFFSWATARIRKIFGVTDPDAQPFEIPFRNLPAKPAVPPIDPIEK